jgi:hypothetical protein
MKISLAKHGGHAAGMLLGRPPRVLDTGTLSPTAAEEVSRLVEAARAVLPVEDNGPGRARDAMSYTITVEEGDCKTVLKCSDANMFSTFANLLGLLERHLK